MYIGPVCWSGPPRRPESAETGPKQRADTHTVSAGRAFALTCGAGPHPAPWAHCQSLSRSTGAAPGTAAKGCQPATCRPMVQPSTRPTEGHQLRRPARSFMLLTRVDGADSAGPRYEAGRSTKQRPVPRFRSILIWKPAQLLDGQSLLARVEPSREGTGRATPRRHALLAPAASSGF